ncbi:hypothetical protein [Ilumatobacter sp.]|uniref:hypothetical protein n=1 Tax=Ilumatobacter sp. TaxID=1967498 RepID=UPI003AF47DCC
MAGPRWYRARIRLLGPLFGLIPMIILGAIAMVALRLGDGRTSGLIGLVAGVSAAPGLLIAGAPFSDDAAYPLAVLASTPLWLLLGLLASRRATRSSIATWRDYAREMLWLTIAVVLGAGGALIAATASLGESLIA